MPFIIHQSIITFSEENNFKATFIGQIFDGPFKENHLISENPNHLRKFFFFIFFHDFS